MAQRKSGGQERARLQVLLREELPRTILQIALSAAGFLIALAVNQQLAEWGERETYRAMITSLQAEADYNADVLVNHVNKFRPGGGVVLAEFSYSTSAQLLSNPTFVKYGRENIQSIEAYVRVLALDNSYRRDDEDFKLRPTEVSDSWKQNLNEQWGIALDETAQRLKAVQAILPEPR